MGFIPPAQSEVTEKGRKMSKEMSGKSSRSGLKLEVGGNGDEYDDGKGSGGDGSIVRVPETERMV